MAYLSHSLLWQERGDFCLTMGAGVSNSENNQPRPIAYQDLHTLIQERIKDDIVRNKLKPGDKLPTEETLSEQLGVSRTAIREALRGLEALGIVGSRQGVGRVIQPFGPAPILENLSFVFRSSSVLHVMEIRKALDAYFVEQAIANLTEKDTETLSDIVELMQERADAGQDIEREDYRFHELLFRRCDNPLALQLFEITWQVRNAAMEQSRGLHEMPPGTAQEHRSILEAIKQGDVAPARQLLIDHHWSSEQRFREAIERERSEP